MGQATSLNDGAVLRYTFVKFYGIQLKGLLEESVCLTAAY